MNTYCIAWCRGFSLGSLLSQSRTQMLHIPVRRSTTVWCPHAVFINILEVYLRYTWMNHGYLTNDNFMHYFHALLSTRPAFLSALAINWAMLSIPWLCGYSWWILSINEGQRSMFIWLGIHAWFLHACFLHLLYPENYALLYYVVHNWLHISSFNKIVMMCRANGDDALTQVNENHWAMIISQMMLYSSTHMLFSCRQRRLTQQMLFQAYFFTVLSHQNK
jgi:hypothetical protein